MSIPYGTWKFIGLSGVVALVCGCSEPPPSDAQPGSIDDTISPIDANLYPADKLVCDPWDSGEAPQSNGGLKAELFYLKPGEPHPSRAQDYVEKGIKSEKALFFTHLNFPTRKFERGFATETGGLVRDEAGRVLNEYFALRFSSVLRLAPGQDEGLYELAVLADDGAVLRMRDASGQWKTVVDNDGDHMSRLACGGEFVQLKRGTERPIELTYYQGARSYMSLIVLMRPVTMNDGVIQGDPACGLEGNDMWFDADAKSTPRKAYNDLLARGWRPLSKDNYSLPIHAFFNPCQEGPAPKILNLEVSEVSSHTVTLRWQTDIPATSQISYLEAGAGSSELTRADNQLRTRHHVVLKSLKAATIYSMEVVSMGESFGRAVSESMQVQTAP